MDAEKKYVDLLHKELSYQIRGCAIEVRKNYGPGHKEAVYQNAYQEELEEKRISFKRELAIRIYSNKTGKLLGSYRPDFLIDDKVIVEIKALQFVPKIETDTFYNYLRNSEYELGFLINFGGEQLMIKRTVYSNDRKPMIQHLSTVNISVNQRNNSASISA